MRKFWTKAEDDIIWPVLNSKGDHKVVLGARASEKLREAGYSRSTSGCISRYYEIKKMYPHTEKLVSTGPIQKRITVDVVKGDPFLAVTAKITQIHIRGHLGVHLDISFDDDYMINEVVCRGPECLLINPDQFNRLIDMSDEQFEDQLSIFKTIRSHTKSIIDKDGITNQVVT